MVDLAKIIQIILSTVFLLGFVMYFVGRVADNPDIESFGILIIVVIPGLVMGKILTFILKKSPYLRARHRVLVLSISFLLFIVFEGFAVVSLGFENFTNAALYFFLELVGRVGITIGIFMPVGLSDFLRKFIK